MLLPWIVKRLCLIAALLFILTAWGCAGHLVRIKGNAMDAQAQPILAGSKIYVFEDNRLNQGRQGSLRLRNRVESLLKKQGFEPSDVHNADYFMVLSYGAGSAREIQEKIPMITAYAPFASVESVNPGQSSPTVQPGGVDTIMVMHTRTVFDIWLAIKLLDGPHYRQTKDMKTSWTGKAWISENHATSMGKAVGAMLPLLIDTFGQTTEKETIVKTKDFMFQDMF